MFFHIQGTPEITWDHVNKIDKPDNELSSKKINIVAYNKMARVHFPKDVKFGDTFRIMCKHGLFKIWLDKGQMLKIGKLVIKGTTQFIEATDIHDSIGIVYAYKNEFLVTDMMGHFLITDLGHDKKEIKCSSK